jgi:uncharacterized protein (TIGR00730 family)
MHQDPTGSINLPSSKLPFSKTEEQKLFDNFQWQIFRVLSEFIEGFDFISKYEKSVTIFGSARILPKDENYQLARELGFEIAKMGYAVVTGGGPGIMEGANRGARDAQKEKHSTRKNQKGVGPSVGLNIQLPNEQRINPFVNESMSFRFFFTRKTMMSFAAEVYVFFPGGIGTLDELFEVLELVQNHKISAVPIILMGRDYWQNLLTFLDEIVLKKYQAIDPPDLKLFKIVDTVKEAMTIIKKAPIRQFSMTNLSGEEQ